MTKNKYNKELLEEICIRDNCKIDFDKIEKYNQGISIEYICKCNNIYIKNFRILNDHGAFLI